MGEDTDEVMFIVQYREKNIWTFGRRLADSPRNRAKDDIAKCTAIFISGSWLFALKAPNDMFAFHCFIERERKNLLESRLRVTS